VLSAFIKWERDRERERCNSCDFWRVSLLSTS